MRSAQEGSGGAIFTTAITLGLVKTRERKEVVCYLILLLLLHLRGCIVWWVSHENENFHCSRNRESKSEQRPTIFFSSKNKLSIKGQGEMQRWH